MNNNKVKSMKKLVRTVALLGSVAMLTLATGLPAQAASPSPTPAPSPSAPKASQTPSPKASASAAPSPSPKAAPTAKPLGPNAAKPGVKPKAAARSINKGAAPVTAPSAALPTTNCLSGACSLWAQSGTITVPGNPAATTLPIWGFSTSSAPNSGVVGGPTLVVNEGDSVTITLTNNLPSPAGVVLSATPSCPDDPRCISLDLPAVTAPAAATTWPMPDTTGVAFGSSKPYSLGHLPPGTYLYEAGPTPHAQRQLRMGLAGLLVVRPAAFTTLGLNGLPLGGAYDGATPGTTDSPFQAESVAALNEFDPDFSNNPFGADPIDFNASVFTLNGRAYNPDPAAAPLGKIDVGPGDVLLLRYANLGSHDRGMTIVNHRQKVLAEDSNILRNPGNVATKWLTAGQVSDAFVSIDPKAPLGTHISIFESGYHLNNGPSLGLGGAMSYLDVVSGVAGVPAGPLSSVTIAAFTAGSTPNVALPAPTGEPTWTGTQPLTFNATITASTGGLLDAEWFLDAVGQPGTGYKFTDPTKATCSPTPVVTAIATVCMISAAQLTALLLLAPPVDGDHLIWVHGLDANGWGVVSGDVFTVNTTGPLVGSFSAHVTPTNGNRLTDVANGACTGVDVLTGCLGPGEDKPSKDLVLLGTATASLSDWVVQGGEYCLMPSAGATPTACPSSGGASDTLPANPVLPATVKLVTTPGPTQGNPAVFSGPAVPDACVPLPSPPGVNPPSPGAAPGGSSMTSFCAVVPSAALTNLAEGLYTVYFHAKEAQSSSATGLPLRWGAYSVTGSIQFSVDRSGPKVVGSPTTGIGTCAPVCFIDNNPNNGTVFSAGNLNFLDSLQVSARFDDSATGNSTISSGEVIVTDATVTADPIPVAQYGTGAEMVPFGGQWDSPTKVAYAYVPLAVLTAYKEGYVRFWLHGQDIAGNWGAWSYVDLKLDRTAPTITSATITAGTTGTCNGLLVSGCSVSFSATDPLSGGVNSNIVQGEWFTGTDPGQGIGFPFGIVPGTTVNGSFNPIAASGTQISFRVKDAAGNWSLVRKVVAP